ncbi:MAG TPA: serine hydrolase domain-containing protein [Chitinophagales bacterium]|nr:serine hydrolase domain-containing protein [Chitinophagales bacterium]
MIKSRIIIILQLFLFAHSFGQNNIKYADSIRISGGIPELAYAVVSGDSILEMAFLGYHSINLKDTASVSDRFHIGSNTKAMTAFIIAKYVEKGKLNWDTKFFDLFPEWKKESDSAYYNITLQDLLSHRARIQPFTEDEEGHAIPEFKGTKQQKRTEFGKFVLTLKPVEIDSNLKYTYSNAGYTLATLMLEKVSGKSWEDLVIRVFNRDLKINTQFSWPDNQSKKDTWGHIFEDGKLVPVASTIDYHLDFTEPAGDINITLPDYIKFVQLNINGLKGKDNYLRATTYQSIHKGIENYSLGWANIYENGKEFSAHSGSAGTYFCTVSIDRKKYISYIIFANSATESTVAGVRLLMRKLKEKYGS